MFQKNDVAPAWQNVGDEHVYRFRVEAYHTLCDYVKLDDQSLNSHPVVCDSIIASLFPSFFKAVKKLPGAANAPANLDKVGQISFLK